jgi:hypothetical protein
MAWQKVSYKLTSDCPMIMHSGQTADPRNKWAKAIKQISGKRKKTDADYEEMARLEFSAGLYMGKDGPIIPAANLDAMIINGAKKSREGVTAKSGVFALGDMSMIYTGPRKVDDLWEEEEFRFSALVRVGQARVARMRPIFREWSGVVTLNYEDSVLNLSRLDDWMFVAGTQVGLGDWRPQHGRFSVERLNE